MKRKSNDAVQECGIKRFGRAVLLLLVLLVGLTACGGGDENPDPTPGPPTATLQPTPAPVIGSVIWTTELTNDGLPGPALPEVTRNAAQIFAAIEVRHLLPDTTFSVSWTMDDTPLESLGATVSLVEGQTEGWVTATLTWSGAALWPVGTLGVSFVASSGEVISGTVQIISG